MGRCRFVQPDVVRLPLADVAARAHARLLALEPAAPPEQIAASAARVQQALVDGEWILVKKELNSGESRAMLADLVIEMRQGERPKLDPKRVGVTKLVQYIVEWSLLDIKGQPVAVTPAAIDHLDEDTFDEITAALAWHEQQIEAERRDRKNAPATVSTLSPA